jgi:hypothetical protein
MPISPLATYLSGSLPCLSWSGKTQRRRRFPTLMTCNFKVVGGAAGASCRTRRHRRSAGAGDAARLCERLARVRGLLRRAIRDNIAGGAGADRGLSLAWMATLEAGDLMLNRSHVDRARHAGARQCASQAYSHGHCDVVTFSGPVEEKEEAWTV